MDSANGTINMSSCHECVCIMITQTANTSIVSLNCLIKDNSSVICELFNSSTYDNSSFYEIKNTSNSTFCFRELPPINQRETTIEITTEIPIVTSTDHLTTSVESPTTTTEFQCVIMHWNTTPVVLATLGNGTNQVKNPQTVFIVNGSDILYIADADNHRILKFDHGLTTTTVVAGGQRAGRNATQLNKPVAIYVDKYENIFVSDRSNYRVQVFTNGSIVGRTIYSNETIYTPGLYGGMFGLSVDLAGNIYMAEYSPHRVSRLAPNATNATIIAGNGTTGNLPYLLSTPTGIYIDPFTDTLYIANQGAHCSVKWKSGDIIGTAVAGICGTQGTNETLLSQPKGLTFDQYGNMFVVDGGAANNSRIIMFCPNSMIGIPIITNGLKSPQTVALDSNFSLYVADTGNNRVLKYNRL